MLLSDVYQSSTFGPWKRALAKVDKEETFHLRHGRTWCASCARTPTDEPRCRRRSTGCSSSRSNGSGCRTAASSTRSSSSTASRGNANDELRQAWMAEVVPFMEEIGIRRAGALRRGAGRVRDRLPVPGGVRRGARVVAGRRPDFVGRRDVRWRARGPMNRDYVARCSAVTRRHLAWRGMSDAVEARLWEALRGGRGPGDPVSVLGLGLIVSLDYLAAARGRDLRITFTSMGCPATGVHRGRHPRRCCAIPTSTWSRSRSCGIRCGPRPGSGTTRGLGCVVWGSSV